VSTTVTFDDAFWAPRLEVNRTVTLPHVYRKLEETGRISAFDLNFQRPVPSPIVLIFGWMPCAACVCPLVQQNIGVVSTTLCHCSEGFAERMFSAVIEKPVKATVTRSILRGDKSCVYTIQIL
jgi:hypothetical protein